MRDVLQKLQVIREGLSPEDEDEDEDEGHEAVLSQDSSSLSLVLQEAQSIRRDVQQLSLRVQQLKLQNERFGASVRRLSLLKTDSDASSRSVQALGRAVHARLRALGQERHRLEASHGWDAAVSRVARAQQQALARLFHAAMMDYQLAEETQKKACGERIRRQASILDAGISAEALDKMVERGGEGWSRMFQSLQGGRSSGWALKEIQGRHQELVLVEARLKEMQDLFLQMAALVEEQGGVLDSIQVHVCQARDHVQRTNTHMKKAVKYKRKNPFQHLCPCWPCWR